MRASIRAMPACARPGTYIARRTHDSDAALLVRRHPPGFLARLQEGGQGALRFVGARSGRQLGDEQTS